MKLPQRRKRLLNIVYHAGIPVPALLALLVGSACSDPPAPKAYIGLFGDNAVAVLDTGTNRVVSTIPVPKGPHGIAVTPDGRKVYVSSEGDTKVSIISTKTDLVTGSIEVGARPHGLTMSADGKLLLLASNGTGNLVLIDPVTDMVIGQVPVPLPHTSTISADGRTAFVGSQATPPMIVSVDLTRRAQTNTATLANTPRALSTSLSGTVWFTATGLDSVQVFEPAANRVTGQIATGGSPHAILPDPSQQTQMVVSQIANDLEFIGADNTVSAKVPVGKLPHWIATSANGAVAFVTNESSNDLSIVDVVGKTVTATVPVGHSPRKIAVQPVVPGGG